MFKQNQDGMRMEPTPERVLSLCRMLARESLTREELRSALTLDKNGDKQNDEISKSVAVAMEELGLVRAKNDRLGYVGPAEAIETPDRFRKYVSSKVFARKDTTFVMFSRWVISQNEALFPLKKWEVMGKTCGAQVAELAGLGENAVLGWRFWAAFLGLGYLSGTMFIPNMKLRLQDLLAGSFSKSFAYGEAVRAEIFTEWLAGKMPEADLSGRLPLALSAGLRTLQELELIRLETWQDSSRVMLYYVDGEPVNDFSHITVKEAVCR